MVTYEEKGYRLKGLTKDYFQSTVWENKVNPSAFIIFTQYTISICTRPGLKQVLEQHTQWRISHKKNRLIKGCINHIRLKISQVIACHTRQNWQRRTSKFWIFESTCKTSSCIRYFTPRTHTYDTWKISLHHVYLSLLTCYIDKAIIFFYLSNFFGFF